MNFNWLGLGLATSVVTLLVLGTRSAALAETPVAPGPTPGPGPRPETPPGPGPQPQPPPGPGPRPQPPRYIYPVGSVVQARVRLSDGSASPFPAALFKILDNVPSANTVDNQGIMRGYRVQEADCVFFCNHWFIDDGDIESVGSQVPQQTRGG